PTTVTSDENLFAYFHRRFSEQPGDELLATSDGTSYTYRDIDRMSARIASYLCSAGAEPGDRVSVQVEKSPANLGLYLACLRAGLVFHPINPGYKSRELGALLRDAAPAVVVCDAGNERDVAELAADAGARIVLTLNADGSGSLTEGAAAASADFAIVPRRKE